MSEKIAFIGLGAMGGPMAANLVRGGFALTVLDSDAAKVARLVDLGAATADSPAAAARAAAKTIVMVETTAQAEAVVLGADGVASGATSGHTVICMSTIDPLAARAMHDRLAADGIRFLDAPVSGGTVRAEAGELSIIAGGGEAVFEDCRPAFEAMAANLFHVGEVGQGLAMKLANNLLIQVGTVAVAEAMVLGAKAGLDPETMFEVIRVSTGASFAFETRVPRILSGDFEPGGTFDISYKDMELETSFAKQLGVPLLVTNVAQQVYEMAKGAGYNKEDGAAVVKLYEKLAGIELGPR